MTNFLSGLRLNGFSGVINWKFLIKISWYSHLKIKYQQIFIKLTRQGRVKLGVWELEQIGRTLPWRKNRPQIYDELCFLKKKILFFCTRKWYELCQNNKYLRVGEVESPPTSIFLKIFHTFNGIF